MSRISRIIWSLASLAAAGCTTGPAWTALERQELAALQAAALAQLAKPAEALTTPATARLPEDAGVDQLDAHLQPLTDLFVGDADKPDDYGWSIGANPALEAMVVRRASEVALTTAGYRIAGFDAVQAFAAEPERGAVLLATRRGEQTVATAQRVWSGQLWHHGYRPELSTDGSHFVYVKDGLLSNTAVLARTNAPEHGIELKLPGVIRWPVWPGRDGKRLRYLTEVGGHVEVRDGDRVVATADSAHHAHYDAGHDLLTVHLETAGKTRMLIGDRLTPPLDSYRWQELSRDGAHYAAVGREGDLDHLIVDGEDVAQHPRMVFLDLAEAGTTWACVVQEGFAYYVLQPNTRLGPFEIVTQVALAPDGSQLAICTRDGPSNHWTVEGRSIGAGFLDVSEVILLEQRAGIVFYGRDAAGWWIVSPNGRDGPWDRIGSRHWKSQDGRNLIVLTQRGREAHRRVVPLQRP